MVYRWRDTAMLMCRRVGHIVTDVNNHRDTAMLMCCRVGHIVTDVNNHRDTAMLMCRRVGHIVTDVNNHRDTAMLMCRRVGHIVTDVNNHRDTAMLMCRRVGHIVTDVNNHRDTAMLMCRRVGHIVTDVNNHRDTAMLMCRRVGNIVTDVNVCVCVKIHFVNVQSQCCFKYIKNVHNLDTLFDKKWYYPWWDLLGLLVRTKWDIQLSHASDNETVGSDWTTVHLKYFGSIRYPLNEYIILTKNVNWLRTFLSCL